MTLNRKEFAICIKSVKIKSNLVDFISVFESHLLSQSALENQRLHFYNKVMERQENLKV